MKIAGNYARLNPGHRWMLCQAQSLSDLSLKSSDLSVKKRFNVDGFLLFIYGRYLLAGG
jgi:hypothetical protein